jgi:hypothetical protein
MALAMAMPQTVSQHLLLLCALKPTLLALQRA